MTPRRSLKPAPRSSPAWRTPWRRRNVVRARNPARPRIVPVRDSKVPHGLVLTFTAASWTAFITALKAA
ncbi:DUF397 domain-containing protein [Streptomyces chrestomyceticus]|uniref:DUF397 domain-containing protein n=1 Tax=Streptomyces chrestomyceticus TaxID=68185 RepID=A0ABU7WWM3_9ACTN